jgi:hypothetical protein
MRPNFLDSKIIARRLGMATVAVMTAYTMGALMMAGIALGGWEYTKRLRLKEIRGTQDSRV